MACCRLAAGLRSVAPSAPRTIRFDTNVRRTDTARRSRIAARLLDAARHRFTRAIGELATLLGPATSLLRRPSVLFGGLLPQVARLFANRATELRSSLRGQQDAETSANRCTDKESLPVTASRLGFAVTNRRAELRERYRQLFRHWRTALESSRR